MPDYDPEEVPMPDYKDLDADAFEDEWRAWLENPPVGHRLEGRRGSLHRLSTCAKRVTLLCASMPGRATRGFIPTPES